VAQNTKWEAYLMHTTIYHVKKHYNWWEAIQLLMATFQPPFEVLVLGYGQVYKILCGKISNRKQYEITIGNFLNYICIDFMTMVSSSFGKRGKWVPCKQTYYVLQHVMYCGQFEIFIHFLTLSCNEVHGLLAHFLAFT
jgi:hypothetical protein